MLENKVAREQKDEDNALARWGRENYYWRIYFSQQELLLPLCRRANTCFICARAAGYSLIMAALKILSSDPDENK